MASCVTINSCGKAFDACNGEVFFYDLSPVLGIFLFLSINIKGKVCWKINAAGKWEISKWWFQDNRGPAVTATEAEWWHFAFCRSWRGTWTMWNEWLPTQFSSTVSLLPAQTPAGGDISGRQHKPPCFCLIFYLEALSPAACIVV